MLVAKMSKCSRDVTFSGTDLILLGPGDADGEEGR